MGAINHGLKEPEKWLFFKGGQYFAPVNGKGYNQSQLLLMDVLPSADIIAWKTGISLLAAPSGVNYVNIRNSVPSQNHLERERWKEVTSMCLGIAQSATEACWERESSIP